ncbi:oligosaccharide flippase family protein [Methylobacterium sp. WL69]|uniref:oligosaccharide flippase family protein n=1 Tax=Methylobacterium sp. WL69 TaxID=2603893 RepID=UPI0011CCDA28|nr:oligosaccharide flippase family protein [Methylobacterium sp. WL69]TXM78372.1 oligosaccharide flippase family protein [Methylobacterium sp. WL69]
MNAAAGGVTGLAKIGIQLALLPIMARLLGPEEYGLYALALPTVAFFTVLADGGIGLSLAREREASTLVWSTAFWLLLGTCSVIAAIVTSLGFVLGAVSDQPRLPGIVALLSVSFLLMAISALPAARLVRRGNLVLHSIGDIVSTTVGAGVAVVLAVKGAGAWSLAAQYLVGFVVRAVIFNAAAFERPTLVFDFSAIWPHVTTGGSVIGSRLAEFVGRAIENLLYGQTFGPAALGAYTLANQIPRFLCEAAGNPIWGALYAHAVREDPREVEPMHARLTHLLALILFPAAALLTASAPQVFLIAFGPKWIGATGLIQILLPFYALNAVASQCGAVLLANGRGGAMFWTLSGLSAGRLLAVLAGPWIGVYAVAAGVGAANVAYAIAMFVALGRTTGSSPMPLLKSLIVPILASVVAALVYLGTIDGQSVSLARTALSLTAGAAAYLAVLLALEYRELRAMASTLRRLTARKT